MKHKLLKCSLCCDKSFETKLDFANHLTHILANLACPICDNKSASLSHLIEHLNIDNCQPAYGYENFEEVKQIIPIKNISLTESVSEHLEVEQLDENVENNDVNESNIEEHDVTEQITIAPSDESVTVVDSITGESTTPVSSSMYIQIYDKNIETGCLQSATQKLKLVTGDGHVEQYVIMSTQDSETKIENVQNAVVTKQNSDGTISLHTIKGECDLLNADTPCHQNSTQKLKLINEDGHLEQFVIMTTDQGEVKLENSVVTKQNSDGTISLQTINDSELIEETGTDTVIAPSEKETEDTQDELYSCNTCGVTFSSVFDHIQNYHNDQEVVVEEPFDEDPRFQESTTNRQEVTKRVITDTGDIVDATSIEDSKISDIANEEPLMDVELRDKGNQQQNKRFVQIDKFCDSLVKNINPEDNSGPYHTVMLKEATVNGKRVKNYHCMTCNIYASNLDDFKNQPCKIPKYPCPHCPVAYENSKSLCAHMKVHKNKPDEKLPPRSDRFACEVCNTIFYTNKSLKLHKRMHDPVKTRPLEPPLETVDGTEGSPDMYQCDICDKIIPFDYKVIHQNSHKNSNQLNCGICNKKFHSNEYLEMHMSVHNMDKVSNYRSDKALPYSCLYCNRRFARPHEKVKHERIHTGEKPHSCEICGKSFRVAYCLTLHMRTHTGVRPYACTFCHKRFKAHSVYNHHLLTHSEVRRYKCPFCPKAFKTSVQLAGHKNSHTKPFSCQQCNRPFASLYAVRVHTETHARQNNLKFSCALCGASYARAFALKDHMKQIHHINATDLVKDSEENIKEGAETDGEMMTTEDAITEEITALDMPADPLTL